MEKNKTLVAAVICAILFASGCSGSMKSMSGGVTSQSAPAADYGVANEAAYDTSYNAEGYAPESPEGESGLDEGRMPEKIIQSGHIELGSSSFDMTIRHIKELVETNEGFVQDASLQVIERRGWQGRYYHATLRVPADRFQSTKNNLEQLGKVINSRESAENVTASYYDMESRLKTREIEEQRVLEMIQKAEKVEDLLMLEQRLGEIRTDIELYQSRMLNIDRLSAYATITVQVTEMTPEESLVTSNDLGDRVRSGFIKSVNMTVYIFQEIVVFLAGALVPAVLIGILVTAGILSAKAYGRKKRKEETK